ncbi:MAG: pilus assembly protein [Methylobacter sp.]|nr:pilus assembly protein [Methylobacter sp.]
MMANSGFQNPRSARGASMIEMCFVLPVMLMLVLGVVDFARAIQFNNILVAMSREGANLASRTNANTANLQQNIITALNSTSNPLVMPTHGMIYITKIIGTHVSNCTDMTPTFCTCTTYPKVETQIRSILTNPNDVTLLPSRVWTCPTSFSNSDGSCINSSTWINPSQTSATLPLTLCGGQEIYAVETLYNYQVIVNYVMKTGPRLYSLTAL